MYKYLKTENGVNIVHDKKIIISQPFYHNSSPPRPMTEEEKDLFILEMRQALESESDGVE